MVSALKKAVGIVTSIIIVLTMGISVSASSAYKLWKQYDSRWGDMYMGGSSETMTQVGCAVTSIAILAVHSGSATESSIDPGKLCSYLNESGGLDSNANIYWGAVSGMVPSLTYSQKMMFSSSDRATITQEIADCINAGYYLLVSVRYEGHWVAIDTVSDGEVYMMDPGQSSSNNLFDYYDASGIKSMRLYKGKNAPAKVSVSAPSDNNTSGSYETGHYKTTAALNLRSSATTDSSVLTVIPNGTSLNITKINGVWGKTSYNGKSGWVCLDYTSYVSFDAVTTTAKVTAAATTTTTTTTTSLTVSKYLTGHYKTTDPLNLRVSHSTSADIRAVINEGTIVLVKGVYGDWGNIEYNGNNGWINLNYADYIEINYNYKNGSYHVTPKSGVYMRTAPGTQNASVCQVPYNALVYVKSVTAGWGSTSYNGNSGYISMSDLSYALSDAAATTTKATTSTTTTTTTTTTTKTKTTTAPKTTTTVITMPNSISGVKINISGDAVKGDFNGDRQFTNEDLIILNGLLAMRLPNNSVKMKYIMDVNADGVTDERDSVYLLKMIHGRI